MVIFNSYVSLPEMVPTAMSNTSNHGIPSNTGLQATTTETQPAKSRYPLSNEHHSVI